MGLRSEPRALLYLRLRIEEGPEKEAIISGH